MGPLDAYTDQESDRLSRIMVNNPHAAADEMRDQLQQLDPRTATDLIRKTKDNEFVGGLGDLQIQVELTQDGCDSGFRNVTMATPEGVEQIAEIQTNRPNCGPVGQDGQYGYDANGYRVDPLAAVAGMIVGDLMWGRQRGYDFDDDRYRGWAERQDFRQRDWDYHRDEFRQNWQDQAYRNRFQDRDWQQNAWTTNNTYITNNRINNTTINETIINNPRQPYAPPRQVYGDPAQQMHGPQERPMPWNGRPGQAPGGQWTRPEAPVQGHPMVPGMPPGGMPPRGGERGGFDPRQQQMERQQQQIIDSNRAQAQHQRELEMQQRQLMQQQQQQREVHPPRQAMPPQMPPQQMPQPHREAPMPPAGAASQPNPRQQWEMAHPNKR